MKLAVYLSVAVWEALKSNPYGSLLLLTEKQSLMLNFVPAEILRVHMVFNLAHRNP